MNIGKFITLLDISYQPKIITITGTNGKGSTLLALSQFFLHNIQRKKKCWQQHGF